MTSRQVKTLKQSNILKYRYLRFLGRKEKHLVNKIAEGQRLFNQNAFKFKEIIINEIYKYKKQVDFYKIIVDHKLYSCNISVASGLNNLLYTMQTINIVGYRKLRAIVRIIQKEKL